MTAALADRLANAGREQNAEEVLVKYLLVYSLLNINRRSAEQNAEEVLVKFPNSLVYLLVYWAGSQFIMSKVPSTFEIEILELETCFCFSCTKSQSATGEQPDNFSLAGNRHIIADNGV